MRVRHSARALVAVATVVAVGTGGTAWAAAPSNDTVGGATTISALSFDDIVDVSQATTDSDDSALNQWCGAPATQASIWYSYTAPADVAGLIVDVSQSTYSSGVIVAEPDTNGGLMVDACGPGTVGLQLNPGTTYTILAFNDTPGSTGGDIHLHAEAATLPTLALTVNKTGKVDRYGNALISGTYTCTDASWVGLETDLTQAVGRFSIQGWGWGEASTCDGAAHAWNSVVTPNNGKFAGGKSAAFAWGFACGNFFCTDSYTSQTVRLSK